MTFIVLDDKEWCKGIYKDGNLSFDHLPENLDRTWKYVPYLADKNVEYANLYCEGQTLDEVCPDSLKPEWEYYNKRLLAFVNSFKESKIDLNEHCINDLLPLQFLLEFCELKFRIVDHIFKNYKKPVNYEFSSQLEIVLDQIRNQKLNIDTTPLLKRRYESKVREFLKNIENWKPVIDFDQFGTKTGRLTTKKGTFSILNLNSEFRSIIKPTNDFWLELDFNAAELRILLALSGQQQPLEDLHAFNAKRLGVSRDEAKKDAFAWLYGSSKVDSTKFNEIFNTKEILSKFYDGEKVTNYYGREIPADDFHAINYIVQSTTADFVLRQIVKLANFLKGRQSKIGFIVHDSVLIDMSNSESSLCGELVNQFSNGEFGYLPSRVRLGKDYSALKEVKIK